MKSLFASLALALAFVAGPVSAQPIPDEIVGSGFAHANVVIEFGNGEIFYFVVLFEPLTFPSGLDLLLTLEAELPSFVLILEDFGFGVFVNGIAYEGNADVGFNPPFGFWQYWRGLPLLETWILSPVGASDRVVTNGDWDGWRWGDPDPPEIEPPLPSEVPGSGPASLALLSGAFVAIGIHSTRRA